MNCDCPYHKGGCPNEGTDDTARYGKVCHGCYLHLLEEWGRIFMNEFGFDNMFAVEQAKKLLQVADVNAVEFSKEMMRKGVN